MKVTFQVRVCQAAVLQREGLEASDDIDKCTYLNSFKTREEAQHYADNIAFETYHIRGMYKVFMTVTDSIYSSRIF